MRFPTGGGQDLVRLFAGSGIGHLDGLRLLGRRRFFGRFLGERPRQETSTLDDLGHGALPLDGHDVDPGHPLDLTDLVDDVHRDLDALFLLVLGALHPANDIVGDLQAGHEIFHVAGHAQRFRRRDAGQDVALFVQAEIADHLHEAGELLDIVDDLCLDEVGPALHLFGQAGGPELEGTGKGIGGATKEKAWFVALDLLTALEATLVAHGPGHAEELDGVHVEHPLGPRMVAELLVIAGEAKQVLEPQGGGAEDIGLHADPVAVPAGHLDHRLHPFRHDDGTGGDARHANDGGLTVGDVDRVHLALENVRLLPDHAGIARFRRSQFTGDRKMALGEYPF